MVRSPPRKSGDRRCTPRDLGEPSSRPPPFSGRWDLISVIEPPWRDGGKGPTVISLPSGMDGGRPSSVTCSSPGSSDYGVFPLVTGKDSSTREEGTGGRGRHFDGQASGLGLSSRSSTSSGRRRSLAAGTVQCHGSRYRGTRH